MVLFCSSVAICVLVVPPCHQHKLRSYHNPFCPGLASRPFIVAKLLDSRPVRPSCAPALKLFTLVRCCGVYFWEVRRGLDRLPGSADQHCAVGVYRLLRSPRDKGAQSRTAVKSKKLFPLDEKPFRSRNSICSGTHSIGLEFFGIFPVMPLAM